MRKIIFTLLSLLLGVCFASELSLRGYNEYEIPAGTYLQVISLQEFSTAYCEEGDSVLFETTSDIYLYNKNVIPTGTKLAGYIERKHEPIIGTNAVMRVFINKMYLPDKSEIPIRAFVYTSNNNMIGGGLTAPAKYIKMPHYQRWSMFRAMGTLQCVPGGERKMGEHVTISSGANLLVVLVEPIYMRHSY